MSFQESMWGALPGTLETAQTTYENAFSWGGPNRGLITNALINASAVDPGASPTTRLRPGLVLGVITSSGQWTNYSPTATDGSQVARGVLLTALRMTDVVSGNTTNRFYGVLVGGPVVASQLYGLDQKARADMFGRFVFDDDHFGNRFPWKASVAKTANYTVAASDNGVAFDNTGATAGVKFTLPALANGLRFAFRVVANQNVSVASSEGTNIVCFNNASASTLSFATANQLIGGYLILEANDSATKWHASQLSPSNTLTIA